MPLISNNDMLRDARALAVERVQKITLPRKLYGCDKRLSQYIKEVSKNPHRHNLWELLCLERFIAMVGKYEWRRQRFARVVKFLETIKYPSDKGLSCITLSPVQVFFIAGVYGLYDGDNRLVHNALLFCPRKFGKTTLVAGLAVYELIFGPADGQTYVCANTYKQAKICFDFMRAIMGVLDASGQYFRTNRETIYNRLPTMSSKAECLANNPDSLDGLNASCYIMDEFAQSKTSELRNVMATSTGTRNNPLEIIITTASSVIDGPCVDLIGYYQQILLGEADNDHIFALLYMPDVDDQPDQVSTWRKVQPHLGKTVRTDYYRSKWDGANASQQDKTAYYTKLLNIFCVNESRVWLSANEVRSCLIDWDWSHLPAKSKLPCCVSFDLSVWDDFSAVCYLFFLGSGYWHAHIDYYIPSDTLRTHRNAELYRRWISEGYLRELPGNVIDYNAIRDDIIRRNGSGQGQAWIVSIGYDNYKSQGLVNDLATIAGNIMRPIKQTYGAFTTSLEIVERLVKTKHITFSRNEITPWCFGNAVVDADGIGNRKIVKASQTGKIDGAICVLMDIIQYNILGQI